MIVIYSLSILISLSRNSFENLHDKVERGKCMVLLNDKCFHQTNTFSQNYSIESKRFRRFVS